MIGYCYLYTDHRRNQNDVALHAAGQGGRRIAVGAGQGVDSHALFSQGAGLCNQVFHAAGYAIGSEQSDYRGDSVLEKFAELRFRHTGSRSLLTAASGDVYVHINVSRCKDFSFQVIGFHSRKPLITFDRILHQKNLLSFDQKILFAQFFWCVNFCIFQ